MKQKKINDILYVFDITPYQITQDTDAEVIKVQEECVADFKELNASLADKIVAYNYHAMVAQVPVWAPYVDEPDPPVVENYTFTFYPGAERGRTKVVFSDGQNHQPTVDESHMPGMNNSINIEGYGQYEGYVYTFEVPENIEITLKPYHSIDYYAYDENAFSYDSQTNSLTPSIVMDADKAVYFVYYRPISPGLAWSDDVVELHLGADDNVFPTLSNPNNVGPITYSSEDPSVATIDEYGTVTLLSVGFTNIFASFDGDDTYSDQRVLYTLWVLEAQTNYFAVNKVNGSNPLASNIYDNTAGEWTYNLSYYKTFDMNDCYDVMLAIGHNYSIYNATIASMTVNGVTIGSQVNEHYDFIMPNDVVDCTVQAAPTTYTVTLEGSGIHAQVTVKMNNETVSSEYQYHDVADGTVIDIYPTEDASHYSLQSGATWDTDHWTATVNGADVTIEINYVGAPE